MLARAAHKERVHALERSVDFTNDMLCKLEELYDALTSCSTSCGEESPRDFP